MIDTKVENLVRCFGDNGKDLPSNVGKAFYPRLKDLSNFVSNDIIFITCHGDVSFVPSKMDEFVFLLSMMTPLWIPNQRVKIESYKINGKKIMLPPGQKDYLLPTSKTLDKCDCIYDDDKQLMALMYGYNIYILNDCLHCSNEQDLYVAVIVFEHIINKVVDLWKECE